MSELRPCPQCAELIQPEAILCRYCHCGISDAHFRKCPACAEMVRIEAVFCRYCRQPVAHEQAAERRHHPLEQKFGVTFFALDEAVVRPECLRLLPEEFIRKYHAVPVRKVGKRLLVAMVDPADETAMDAVISRINAEVQPAVCTSEAFDRFMETRYAKLSENSDFDKDDDDEDEEEGADSAEEDGDAPQQNDFAPKEDNGPIITLANMILADGIKCGARQIRIEPKNGKVTVMNVVRGEAKVARSLSPAIAKPLMARFKDMASPHGFTHAHVGGKNYHVKVQATKTEFGDYIWLDVMEPNN